MGFKKLTFAGHAACFIDHDSLQIAIDPWLEGNPLCPDSLKNPEKLDLIVLTHGHADHAADAVKLSNATGASVVAIFELAMILGSEGLAEGKAIPMGKGGSVSYEGVTISLTHAMHSSSYESESRGTLYAGEPCGVVLNDGTRSIYHAGDTALFSDMKLIAETYKPELALLPIGDHFTMGQEEAAKAAQMIGCKTAIPIHYKTFELLAQDAQLFSGLCEEAGITAAELAPGEEFVFEG